MHDDECREDPQRQRNDGNQRRTQVKQKQRANDGHNDKFLNQLVAEVFDRALDEARAVIGWHYLDAFRQTRFQGCELFFDGFDSCKRILA